MAGDTPAATDNGSAEAASSSSAIEWVDRVLAEAVRRRASDLHLEPFEETVAVRVRIDGALEALPPPPPGLASPVASRIKVLGNLDIAERRVPQDGRVSRTVDGRRVDLRISTLPTVFGESVVVRILDRSAMELDLNRLGLPEDVLRAFRDVVRLPSGLVIATGPTGSGKTTTLYSALQLINTPDLKVITAEDPIEYEIDGLMQVPVNAAIGLDFAAALRSFLRQDPDVIMVGEIRDAETAQVAVQASLTGHLVLSTLHTNDAAGAITRLADMGVEPYLIASSVEGVLAQRLVRKLCPHCREAYVPSAAERAELGLTEDGTGSRLHHRSRGCVRCQGSGYLGRTGIFEFLRIDAGMREAVMARGSATALTQLAVGRGMRTLRQDGIRALREGLTSREEVLRHT